MTNYNLPSQRGVKKEEFSLDSGYLPKVSPSKKERPILTFLCFLFAGLSFSVFVIALSL